jgi:hypothetical protein
VLFDQPQQQTRQPSRPARAHPLQLTTDSSSNGTIYTNSAPASTTGLYQQPQQQQQFPQLLQRPQPPLFTAHSNRNVPQHPRAMNEIMTSFDSNSSLDLFTGVYGTDGVMDSSPMFGAESNPLLDLSAHDSLNDQTVSPADVSRNSSFVASGSVPNSAALTNLTSPELDFSPYPDSTYETSPMYSATNLEDTSSWYSLFPDAGQPTVPPMQRNPSQQSNTASSNDSPLVMGASTIEKSPRDSKASPNNAHRRSTSGVSKPRRRAGPLKSIEDYDHGDKAAMKRARNTMAARVSRARKVEHIETLEKRIAELEAFKDNALSALSQFGYEGPLMHSE